MAITVSAADPAALTVSLTGSTSSATAPLVSTVTDTLYRRNG
jgi:hypothetical protein